MPLTGLALCVMNGAVTHCDRFVFNTCGRTIRSASRDKLEGFFSLSRPDNLHIVSSRAAYARIVVTEGGVSARRLWKQKKILKSCDPVFMTDVQGCLCCSQSRREKMADLVRQKLKVIVNTNQSECIIHRFTKDDSNPRKATSPTHQLSSLCETHGAVPITHG